MKIGILLPHLFSWGPQRLVVDQIRNWLEKNDEFKIICLANKHACDWRIVEELRELRIEIIYLDGDSRFLNLNLIPKLRNVFKKERFDLIHTHLIYTNVCGRLASIGLKHKVVTSYHNTDFSCIVESRQRNALRFLTEWVSARLKSDMFISVTKTVQDDHKKIIGNKKSIVVYNGVDIDLLENAKGPQAAIDLINCLPTPRILVVGRLQEQKDPVLSIEIANELKNRDISFTQLFIGDGPLHDDIRNLVDEYELNDYVEMMGSLPLEEVIEFYRGADLLLLPSRMEGFAIVAAEAMFFNIPIVCSDLPVLREVIGEECGTFVKTRDPKAWADAVIHALAVARKGEGRLAGTSRVKRMFSAKENVRRIFDGYGRLLA